MMADFYVTLTPLEPYFFGSERKLGDGVSSSRSSYFIRSEIMPSQTTLIGMIRFFLLKQSESVRNDYQIDTDLIGKESFNMAKYLSESAMEQDFGIIKKISPLFLSDQDERYYIATPKNHQISEDVYTPYEMFRLDADGRKDSYLLKGYQGKKGTAQSYTRLSDGKILDKDDILGETANIGIYKRADNEGYFKKEYKYFKTFYENKKNTKLHFSFFLSLDETSHIFRKKLWHFMKENIIIKDIVYMGLSKSAFALELKKKESDLFQKAANLIKRNDKSELLTYYALSDTLFVSNLQLPFAIIETGNFRHLITGKNKYWNRMEASLLYQVVKPGSMFFLKKEQKENFKNSYDLKNNKKIGMNQLIGSDDYE